MWQVFGWGSGAVTAVCLGLSYGGHLHPAGDSLAVFRPVLLGIMILFSLSFWRWRAAKAGGVAALLLGMMQVADARFHEGPKQWADVTVYQKNLLYLPGDRTGFVDDVLGSRADVVTLQEVSPANAFVLDDLRRAYPYQLLCGDFAVGQIAILSRRPLRDETCSDRTGFARAIVTDPGRGRETQVFSVHLHWPWPYGQQDQVRALTAEMGTFDAVRTIVGGDFNMVPQGHSIARIERVLGVERVGPVARTFSLKGYPLAIDHILATGGAGLLSVRPRLGSDHHGLVAAVEMPL